MNAAQFKQLMVSWRNGAAGASGGRRQRDRQRAGRQAGVLAVHATTARRSARITLSVMRQPGTNTIEVTDRVRALLPLFQAQLPPAAEPAGARRPLRQHPRRLHRYSGHHADHAGAGDRR